MTTGQRDRLFDLAAQMRLVAGPVGSMHSWWDIIFDCELIAVGKYEERYIKDWTVERYIAECERMIAEFHWHRADRLARLRGFQYCQPQPLSLFDKSSS